MICSLSLSKRKSLLRCLNYKACLLLRMASWLIFVTLCCVIVTELEKHVLDIHVLAYVMAERISKRAKNLELLFTARIGFDHIVLSAATTVGFQFEKPIKDSSC